MRRILLILILAHVASGLTADGFADWLKRERESFQGFQSREDKAFREFLSREWEDFEASKSIPSYQEPKFSRQPVVDSGSAPSHLPSRTRIPGLSRKGRTGFSIFPTAVCHRWL